MRKHLTALLLSSGAAAAAIMLSASAASAATWSISPAGGFTATLNGGTTQTLLEDTTSHITLACSASTSTGTVPRAGHGLSGNGIASITKTTWGTTATPCTGPAGSTFTAVSLNTPWKLNAVSFNASVDGGQTTGTISGSKTGVGGKITGTVLGTKCSASFGGTTAKPAKANGLYDNGSHLLAITSVTNLKVTASTCPGVVAGNGATFVTSPASTAGTAVSHGYSVSPKLTLTSP